MSAIYITLRIQQLNKAMQAKKRILEIVISFALEETKEEIAPWFAYLPQLTASIYIYYFTYLLPILHKMHLKEA